MMGVVVAAVEGVVVAGVFGIGVIGDSNGTSGDGGCCL